MNVRPFSSRKQLLAQYGVPNEEALIDSDVLKEQISSLKIKNYYLYQTSKGKFYLKVIASNGKVYTLGKDVTNLDNSVQSIAVTPAKIKKAIEQKGSIAKTDAESKQGQIEQRRAEIELKMEEIKKNMVDALHRNSKQSGNQAYATQLNILKDALELVVTDLNRRNYYGNEKDAMIDMARSEFNKLIKEFVDITGHYPKELDLNVYFKKLKTKRKPVFDD
jgi:hypothetical protein